MLLTTHQCANINIIEHFPDHHKSKYVDDPEIGPTYISKVERLYNSLGIEYQLNASPIWAVPDTRDHSAIDSVQRIEWVLNVPDESILGYVEENLWDDHLRGDREFSEVRFARELDEDMQLPSALICAPVLESQVVEVRAYPPGGAIQAYDWKVARRVVREESANPAQDIREMLSWYREEERRYNSKYEEKW